LIPDAMILSIAFIKYFQNMSQKYYTYVYVNIIKIGNEKEESER